MRLLGYVTQPLSLNHALCLHPTTTYVAAKKVGRSRRDGRLAVWNRWGLSLCLSLPLLVLSAAYAHIACVRTVHVHRYPAERISILSTYNGQVVAPATHRLQIAYFKMLKPRILDPKPYNFCFGGQHEDTSETVGACAY